jgi:hypothetical protein
MKTYIHGLSGHQRLPPRTCSLSRNLPYLVLNLPHTFYDTYRHVKQISNLCGALVEKLAVSSKCFLACSGRKCGPKKGPNEHMNAITDSENAPLAV